MPEGKGLLIVYTGPGKSNTTCALGTAFRAVGQGLRVLMVQAERPYSAVEQADLVTEMKEVKHRYTKGILAQQGIDY